jgi:hypothetical protein
MTDGDVYISNDTGNGFSVLVSGSNANANNANPGVINITETTGALTVTANGITGSGAVTIKSDEGVVLSDVVTGGASSAVVIDSSAGGSITRTAGAGVVTGDSVELKALGDIGASGNVAAISTAANTLKFANSANNNVYITNAKANGSALLVSGTSTGGDISIIETMDAIKTNGVVSTTGAVTLKGNLGIELNYDVEGGVVIIGSTSGSITRASAVSGAVPSAVVTGTTSVTLNAAMGIGAVGPGFAISTAANTLEFDNSDSGDVYITNAKTSAGAVSVRGTNKESGAGNISIIETADAIAVDGVLTGGGAVTITSKGVALNAAVTGGANSAVIIDSSAGGSITRTAGVGVVTGNSVTLKAETGIGDTGLAISTVANTLAFQNSSNEVHISNTGKTANTAVSVSGTNGTTGDISLIETQESIVIDGAITGGGEVTIDSTLGSITGANTVTGAGVTLKAETGIGDSGNEISTEADTLSFTNSAIGGVYISNAKAAPGAVSVSGTSAGLVNIAETSADLNVAANTTITSGDTLNLSVSKDEGIFTIAGSVSGTSGAHTYTADNMIIDGSIDASGQTVTLKTFTVGDTINLVAGSDVFGNSELELSSAELNRITADTLQIGDSNQKAIILSGNLIAPASSNDLTLSASDGITLNHDVTTAGNLVIDSAMGSITATALDNVLTGTQVTLNAMGGIGTDKFAISTIADTLVFDNSGVAVAGDVYISNANASGVSVSGVNRGAGANSIIERVGGLRLDGASTSGGAITLSGNTGVVIDADIGSSGIPSSGVVTIDAPIGDVVVNGDIFSNSDINLNASIGDIIFGANSGLSSTSGDLKMESGGGEILGRGDVSFKGSELLFDNPLSVVGNLAIEIVTLNLQQDITTMSGGDITIVSSDLSFSQAPVISSDGKLTLPAFIATGDLTLNSVDDLSLQLVRITGGDLNINGGSGKVEISGKMNASDNVSITAGDLDIRTATAALEVVGNVTIADQSIGGLGIGLGVLQSGKLNLGTSEMQAITAANLILQSDNGVTLVGDLNAADVTTSLIIAANTFDMKKSPNAIIELGADLDFADTAVTANDALSVSLAIAGDFAMNGVMTSSGTVTVDAGTGVTMGAPSRIATTNKAIKMTATTGDVSLGLLDAGTAAVDITATEGGILNNNGIFVNVTKALVNIKAGSVTLNAANRIGVSNSDAITLDIDPSSSIDLTFGAEFAYINNRKNTTVINNSAGEVVDGLTFSKGVISLVQNIGSDTHEPQLNEGVYTTLLSDDSPISVLGADFENLSGEDDEDSIVSTIIPSVPVLVKGTDGWEFVAPSRREILEKLQQNQEKGVKYIDWL